MLEVSELRGGFYLNNCLRNINRIAIDLQCCVHWKEADRVIKLTMADKIEINNFELYQ